MKKIIVFTDFDGTLTHKDSFWEFIKFYRGWSKLIWGLVANVHYLFAYKFRIISNEQAKERLFTYFFKGEHIIEFQKKCSEFSLTVIPKILREQAKKEIQEHQKKQHQIVIVSASIENYLQDWCEKNSFSYLATQIGVKNGKVSGQFISKNCYGKEKVRRIKERYPLQDYDIIYAYGDTKGDLPMLDIANYSKYKPFHRLK